MNNLLTTVALFWTIHIFLFSEADKQLAETLRRIKFAISVNPNTHKIELDQLEAKQYLSPQDIYDFGEIIEGEIHKNVIKVFYENYSQVESWRTALLINISILTLFALFIIFDKERYLYSLLDVYLVTTLILDGFFYYLVSQLPNKRFTKVAPTHKSIS